ncbi:MAG: isocitrate lyase/PEP mutase family protein [Rhodospirillales bacterium]|nr:isocitrate lyase/PEP mutase family protein [Rhodospirillales bacterium]
MSATDKLKDLLNKPGIITLPGCYDAMSAKLIERAGFSGTFMSGFMVSAARIGMPDTGLISYNEMLDQGRNIASAISIPVIGDGDTGYGNAINVKRTVDGYAQAGMACVMIEDQLAPKRCGHTNGKQVVSREDAYVRLQAAVDAREEGADILIMARTDANGTDGLDEAIERCKGFMDIGVDITFLEAPRDEAEMERYCKEVPGPKMANMVEQGNSPFLTPPKLEEIGYKVVIYPASLMLAGIAAANRVLATLNDGHDTAANATFLELQDVVGFPKYYADEKKYVAK